MKRAVVVGHLGQDGHILFEALSRDLAVLGLDVGCVKRHRLDALSTPGTFDLQDAKQVRDLFERLTPDEVYYLAAHHHASEEVVDEARELEASLAVHVLGLSNVLAAMRALTPRCRLFYAGSSQMFGHPTTAPQDETTPFMPRNVYAITKVAGAQLCASHRERHGLHVSTGILYNHESPRRGPRFVTQRIVRGARQAQRDRGFKLKLGSLSAIVDWGYAPDYVDAMMRIVSQPAPGDYVVATGEPHTVSDFVEVAFARLGLDWKSHVEEDTSIVAPPRGVLVGDARKLRDRTGWKPTLGFKDLVELLVDNAE